MKINQFIMEDRATRFYRFLKHAISNRPFDVKVIDYVKSYPFLKITINEHADRTILITSGIHGNEPCGPLGIIHWMLNNNVPEDVRVIIIPMINPSGFQDNKRRNMNDKDLNRGFRRDIKPEDEIYFFKKAIQKESVDLLLSLHEDHGHKGLYMYYADVDDQVCKDILSRLSNIIPLVDDETVYGDKVEDGLIYIADKNKDPKHAYSLENAIQSLGVPQITFETPTSAKMSKRIKAHQSLISMVISNHELLLL